MKKLIVAIRDDKAEAFGQPQFVRTKGEAIRMVQHAVNSQGSDDMLAQHPEDFRLYAIGEYDEDRGTIAALDVPELVAHLKDLKQ